MEWLYYCLTNYIFTLMKKLLYFLAVILAVVACKPQNAPEEPKKKTIGKLDPNAMILLKPERTKSGMAKAFIYDLSALEVVKQAMAIKWTSHYFSSRYYEEPKQIGRSFPDEHKDFNKPALKMWGTDIIAQVGELERDFIYGYDVYITDEKGDSIAYVPNKTIEVAREKIERAYNDSNYTEVYRLFDEAFTFIPLKKK